MIMPANPSPGQVYRPENIPDLVFEQVMVKAAGRRVPGPRGTVDGAMVITELHMDGRTEDKTFAPGYGEFVAGGGGELEAVALAVPVDAVGGAAPPELAALAGGARASFEAAGAGRWAAAAARVDAMVVAWRRVRGNEIPQLLAAEMTGTLRALDRAVQARDPARARQAALRAEQAALDLRSATGPPPGWTSTASTCGPAKFRSTPPQRTPAPSPATPPPSRPSGPAAPTPPPRPPPSK